MNTSISENVAKSSAQRSVTAKQVRLKLVYIDFWSTVKLSFLAGLCLAIIIIVGTFLVWSILNSTGIFTQVNSLVKDVSGSNSGGAASILGLGEVMGFALLGAAFDLIIITALGAVFALLYNLSVKITGGLVLGFTNN